MILSQFQPGYVVTVRGEFMGEPENVKAYVYEKYTGGYGKRTYEGVSLITENGKDLGGFSIDEQYRHLTMYGDTGQIYNFKNVSTLVADFEKLIKPLFTNKYLEQSHEAITRKTS